MSGFGRSGGGYRKFRAPTNPMANEPAMKYIVDLPGRKMNKRGKYVTERLNANNTAGGGGDKHYYAHIAAAYAQELVKTDLQAFDEGADGEFASGFRAFLEGRLPANEQDRAHWGGIVKAGDGKGLNMIGVPGVQEYLGDYAKARLEFDTWMEKVKALGPIAAVKDQLTLNSLYMYYKYYLHGEQEPEDVFLREWKLYKSGKGPMVDSSLASENEAAHAVLAESTRPAKDSGGVQDMPHHTVIDSKYVANRGQPPPLGPKAVPPKPPKSGTVTQMPPAPVPGPSGAGGKGGQPPQKPSSPRGGLWSYLPNILGGKGKDINADPTRAGGAPGAGATVVKPDPDAPTPTATTTTTTAPASPPDSGAGTGLDTTDPQTYPPTIAVTLPDTAPASTGGAQVVTSPTWAPDKTLARGDKPASTRPSTAAVVRGDTGPIGDPPEPYSTWTAAGWMDPGPVPEDQRINVVVPPPGNPDAKGLIDQQIARPDGSIFIPNDDGRTGTVITKDGKAQSETTGSGAGASPTRSTGGATVVPGPGGGGADLVPPPDTAVAATGATAGQTEPTVSGSDILPDSQVFVKATDGSYTILPAGTPQPAVGDPLTGYTMITQKKPDGSASTTSPAVPPNPQDANVATGAVATTSKAGASQGIDPNLRFEDMPPDMQERFRKMMYDTISKPSPLQTEIRAATGFDQALAEAKKEAEKARKEKEDLEKRVYDPKKSWDDNTPEAQAALTEAIDKHPGGYGFASKLDPSKPLAEQSPDVRQAIEQYQTEQEWGAVMPHIADSYRKAIDDAAASRDLSTQLTTDLHATRSDLQTALSTLETEREAQKQYEKDIAKEWGEAADNYTNLQVQLGDAESAKEKAEREKRAALKDATARVQHFRKRADEAAAKAREEAIKSNSLIEVERKAKEQKEKENEELRRDSRALLEKLAKEKAETAEKDKAAALYQAAAEKAEEAKDQAIAWARLSEAQLKEEVNKATTEVAETKATLDALTRERDELYRQVRDKEGDHKAIEERLRSKDTEMGTLRAEIDRAKERAIEIERQAADAKAEARAKQQEATAATALAAEAQRAKDAAEKNMAHAQLQATNAFWKAGATEDTIRAAARTEAQGYAHQHEMATVAAELNRGLSERAHAAELFAQGQAARRHAEQEAARRDAQIAENQRIADQKVAAGQEVAQLREAALRAEADANVRLAEGTANEWQNKTEQLQREWANERAILEGRVYMNADLAARLDRLHADAAALPQGQRPDYLQSIADPETRSRVTSAFDRMQATTTPLDRPPTDHDALSGGVFDMTSASQAGADDVDMQDAEGAGGPPPVPRPPTPTQESDAAPAASGTANSGPGLVAQPRGPRSRIGRRPPKPAEDRAQESTAPPPFSGAVAVPGSEHAVFDSFTDWLKKDQPTGAGDDDVLSPQEAAEQRFTGVFTDIYRRDHPQEGASNLRAAAVQFAGAVANSAGIRERRFARRWAPIANVPLTRVITDPHIARGVMGVSRGVAAGFWNTATDPGSYTVNSMRSSTTTPLQRTRAIRQMIRDIDFNPDGFVDINEPRNRNQADAIAIYRIQGYIESPLRMLGQLAGAKLRVSAAGMRQVASNRRLEAPPAGKGPVGREAYRQDVRNELPLQPRAEFDMGLALDEHNDPEERIRRAIMEDQLVQDMLTIQPEAHEHALWQPGSEFVRALQGACVASAVRIASADTDNASLEETQVHKLLMRQFAGAYQSPMGSEVGRGSNVGPRVGPGDFNRPMYYDPDEQASDLSGMGRAGPSRRPSGYRTPGGGSQLSRVSGAPGSAPSVGSSRYTPARPSTSRRPPPTGPQGSIHGSQVSSAFQRDGTLRGPTASDLAYEQGGPRVTFARGPTASNLVPDRGAPSLTNVTDPPTRHGLPALGWGNESDRGSAVSMPSQLSGDVSGDPRQATARLYNQGGHWQLPEGHNPVLEPGPDAGPPTMTQQLTREQLANLQRSDAQQPTRGMTEAEVTATLGRPVPNHPPSETARSQLAPNAPAIPKSVADDATKGYAPPSVSQKGVTGRVFDVGDLEALAKKQVGDHKQGEWTDDDADTTGYEDDDDDGGPAGGGGGGAVEMQDPPPPPPKAVARAKLLAERGRGAALEFDSREFAFDQAAEKGNPDVLLQIYHHAMRERGRGNRGPSNDLQEHAAMRMSLGDNVGAMVLYTAERATSPEPELPIDQKKTTSGAPPPAPPPGGSGKMTTTPVTYKPRVPGSYKPPEPSKRLRPLSPRGGPPTAPAPPAGPRPKTPEEGGSKKRQKSDSRKSRGPKD